MNIVFCGGGTVGHITPAIAIAEEFKKTHPDAKIAFIGRKGGYENEVIKKNGYELFEIEISGLIRKFTLRNLKVIKNAISAERRSKEFLKSFDADAVIGTGGYVCFPVIRSASRLGIFTAVHESNVTMGLTSRLLAKKCDILLLGAKTEASSKKRIYTGNPIRAEFYSAKKDTARRILGIPRNVFFIFSVGGSIGSGKLNESCIEMIERFSENDRRVLHSHVCGKRYFEEIKKTKSELFSKKTKSSVIPFTDKMHLYLSASDVVISRCGAMTLSEISASGTASILIPSPNVTADHQTKNAMYFVENGASVLIKECDLSHTALIDAVKDLLENPTKLNKMSMNARALASPNASKDIVKAIEKRVFVPKNEKL